MPDQTTREAAKTLAYIVPGLVVLRDTLRNNCLHLGREKAEEMVKEARKSLLPHAPYPFCGHPEKCVLAGRCTAEIVCND